MWKERWWHTFYWVQFYWELRNWKTIIKSDGWSTIFCDFLLISTNSRKMLTSMFLGEIYSSSFSIVYYFSCHLHYWYIMFHNKLIIVNFTALTPSFSLPLPVTCVNSHQSHFLSFSISFEVHGMCRLSCFRGWSSVFCFFFPIVLKHEEFIQNLKLLEGTLFIDGFIEIVFFIPFVLLHIS